MINRLADWTRTRGILWTTFYTFREAVLRGSAWLNWRLESALTDIERSRMIIGPSTVSNEQNSSAENTRIWSSHDWSKLGEEWTEDVKSFRGLDPAEWKQTLLDTALMPHLKEGLRMLEVGPGGGRWTEHLLPYASRITLVDVSETCLDLCKDRFKDDRIHCHLTDGAPWLDGIEDNSIDFLWSYDAFVHINPNDVAGYFEEFGRVLAPGALGVVHHADTYPSYKARRRGFRSNVSRDMVKTFVERNGMEVVSQDTTTAHMSGDCITTFRKPA